MHYVDSYYSRTLNDPSESPTLDQELNSNVCVIGGGLSGVSTALGLSERGIKCVLLEANKIGWGASGRNGGFASTGFSQNTLKLASLVGEESAIRLHGLTQQAFTLIKTRLKDHSSDIVESTAGAIIASWFDNKREVQNSVTKMNELFGEKYAYWPREKMADHFHTKRYFDGFLKPETLTLHSLKYTLLTAKMAESAGAQIFEHSPVTRVTKKQNRWRVATNSGVVNADHVVYACSGHIGDLHGKLSRATLPVATYILLTEPLGHRLESAIKAPYAVGDNRFSSNYYRVIADSQLLWGGRVSMFQPSQQKLKHIMLKDLLSVYPQLNGITGEVAWGGTMGYARHKMPQIGQLTPGEWYCQGFGGHGMVTTTMGGELIADAIAKSDDTYLAFAPFGLNYVGKPFGPVIAQMAYWSYQLQDALRSRFRFTK